MRNILTALLVAGLSLSLIIHPERAAAHPIDEPEGPLTKGDGQQPHDDQGTRSPGELVVSIRRRRLADGSLTYGVTIEGNAGIVAYDEMGEAEAELVFRIALSFVTSD